MRALTIRSWFFVGLSGVVLSACHRTTMATPGSASDPRIQAPLPIDSLSAGRRIRVWVGPPSRPRWQLGEFQAWHADTLRFIRTDLLAARGPASVSRDSLARLEAFQPRRTRAAGGGCLAFGGFVGGAILIPTVIAHADGQPEAELGYVLAALGALAGCAVGMTVGMVEASGEEWRVVAIPAAAPR